MSDNESKRNKIMKSTIQDLNPKEISSEVFVVSPSLIDVISQKFGNAMAESMNVRPLAQKIQKIAADILLQTLREAKTMGE